VRALTDSTALIDDVEGLRARLRRDGYLYLRGLLPADAVAQVRTDFVRTLETVGWIAPEATVDHPVPTELAVGEGVDNTDYFPAYIELQRLQRFHELGHHPALVGVLRAIFGEPLLVHPRKIARASLPHHPDHTPPHQDYRLIQGSVDTMTVWVPLGDCPRSLGGLRVLEGSHTDGLRAVEPARGAGAMRVVDVTDDAPGWRTADFAAGDVLVFTSLTVHGALRNDEDCLRLSADYRFQPLHDTVLPASLQPHYAPDVPGWDELTTGWSSTESIQAPPGSVLVDVVAPMDPDLRTPPSRLLGSAV
jgi:ectoine hydroxylase-related dioxygenase (phytanoyl-CoA dioxygenase family)